MNSAGKQPAAEDDAEQDGPYLDEEAEELADIAIFDLRMKEWQQEKAERERLDSKSVSKSSPSASPTGSPTD